MLQMFTGLAVADRHEGGGPERDHRTYSSGPAQHGGGGGPVVRDHRTYTSGPVAHGGGGPVVRDHRSYGGGPVRDHREPIHVSNGRYMFPGGVVRTYQPPVIREHYYYYNRRPALIVENYEPVPGYLWMHGNWRWNGYEWLWVPGYWSVNPSVGVSATVVVD
jgi:hypothetical protein